MTKRAFEHTRTQNNYTKISQYIGCIANETLKRRIYGRKGSNSVLTVPVSIVVSEKQSGQKLTKKMKKKNIILGILNVF